MITKKKKTTKKPRRSNPNGANQFLVDPRQALFLGYYVDPKSLTFSNALQSALKAGFERQYAESLLAQMPKWLSESLGRLNMLGKAERNINTMLDLETVEPVVGMFGYVIDKKTKKRITKNNSNLLKIKADVSKFVAERLGKEAYGNAKEVEPQTNNTLIQIVINQPNGETRNKPNSETISRVASTSKS